MQISLKKITKNGKALYLAYDQGLEHGPVEFNDENVDPLSVIDIAKKGGYTGIIFQKGIAEKYQKEIKKSGIPLIVKLNGKTNLSAGEPVSRQLCTVKEAIKLGAKAVGYTIYLGSEFEPVMLEEFDKIEEEAHEKGLPVIAWIYPRGKGVDGRNEKELMAYAARTGLEIGADIVKLKYNGNSEDLKWAVKSAARAKVVISGGTKTDEKTFLMEVRDIKKAGALGLAVGRNVWQHPDPGKITKKIKNILWSTKNG
jgi:class I fructose-bisphosphate aldolase